MTNNVRRSPGWIASVVIIAIGIAVGIGIDRLFLPDPHPESDGDQQTEESETGTLAWSEPEKIDHVELLRVAFEQSRARAHHARTTLELGNLVLDLRPEEFDGAAALLARHVEGTNSENALFCALALFSRWAEHDIARALAIAEGKGMSQSFRMTALQGVLSHWIELDPDAAVMWLKGAVGKPGISELKSAALGMMARTSPEKAAGIALGEAAPKDGYRNLQSVIAVWADYAPKQALDWLEQQESPDLNPRYLPGIVEAWALREPEDALGFALALKDPSLKQSAVNTALSAWAGRDARAAIDYMMGIPVEERPEKMIDSLTWAIGQVPLARIADIVESLPEGADRNEFVSRVANGQAWRDPSGAAMLASALSEGRQRQKTMAAVATAWARKDAPAASEWLVGLPQSPSRDAAVGAFVKVLTDSDPEGAVAWAESITDERRQAIVLMAVALRWKEIDREAAGKWIGSTDLLSDEDKQRLQKQ